MKGSFCLSELNKEVGIKYDKVIDFSKLILKSNNQITITQEFKFVKVNINTSAKLKQYNLYNTYIYIIQQLIPYLLIYHHSLQ